MAGYLALLRFDARAALDARLSTVLSCLCEALEYDGDFNVQVGHVCTCARQKYQACTTYNKGPRMGLGCARRSQVRVERVRRYYWRCSLSFPPLPTYIVFFLFFFLSFARPVFMFMSLRQVPLWFCPPPPPLHSCLIPYSRFWKDPPLAAVATVPAPVTRAARAGSRNRRFQSTTDRCEPLKRWPRRGERARPAKKKTKQNTSEDLWLAMCRPMCLSWSSGCRHL